MKDIKLIFDFDDTIVITNPEYESTNEDTARIIAKAIYDNPNKTDELLAFQRKEDIRLVEKMGLARPRFLISWLNTYQHFLSLENKKEDPVIKKQIELTVNDVFARKFEPYPHAIETIKSLKEEGYSIAILTAGEEDIQRNRIKLVGLDRYVDDIYVRLLKTPLTLQEVIQNHPAKEHVMIGNSLKSDIYPALENKIWAFHVERDTWDLDHYEIDKSHSKYVRIEGVHEVPEKLNIVKNAIELSA